MSGAAIVGLIMAIVGAATPMYASTQANKAPQARMNEGYMQLRDSQDKINQKIAQATENYQTNNRENTQAAEAERIANDIKTDVAESQQRPSCCRSQYARLPQPECSRGYSSGMFQTLPQSSD